ncbi:hypothetical protein ACFOYU_20800 [Microvirga sp. GCM10011540]|uniref:hypothetical protein n=1 Tax=Microvirga sp. GCM10011540 TaxID=3317338 RepID=UPI00360DE13B
MRRRAEQGTRANAGKNGRRKPDLRPQRSTSGRKAAHPSASPLEEAGRIVPASRDLLSRQAKFDEAVQAIRALAKGHTPDPVEAMIQGNPDSDCERIAFATDAEGEADLERILGLSGEDAEIPAEAPHPILGRAAEAGIPPPEDEAKPRPLSGLSAAPLSRSDLPSLSLFGWTVMAAQLVVAALLAVAVAAWFPGGRSALGEPPSAAPALPDGPPDSGEASSPAPPARSPRADDAPPPSHVTGSEAPSRRSDAEALIRESEALRRGLTIQRQRQPPDWMTAPPPPPPAATFPGAPHAPPGKDEIALLERANRLLAQADVGAARLVLEKAAAQGSARAIYRLAQTYDPQVLASWRVLGIRGDPSKARELYARAKAAGLTDGDIASLRAVP